MHWPNGNTYSGHWIKCKKHGYGEEKLALEGTSYKGTFDNNVYHGQGEFTWKDGSYYKGSYQFGLKHGQGILFKKSALEGANDRWVMYEGDFSEDKKEGYGEIKWSNGSIFKGYFKANERHG